MPLNETARNGMANWLAGVAPYLALHSADPGETGSNETTALRLPAAWPSASAGILTAQNLTFTEGEPLGTVTHIGFWSESDGGVFYGSGLLAGDQQFNANGVYNLTRVDVNGTSTS